MSKADEIFEELGYKKNEDKRNRRLFKRRLYCIT